MFRDRGKMNGNWGQLRQTAEIPVQDARGSGPLVKKHSRGDCRHRRALL